MRRRRFRGPIRVLLAALAPALALLGAGLGPRAAADQGLSHLLIGELMTGGAGASDEFVELVNPAAVPLSPAGLELVYVSAGGTVSVRVAWAESAASIAPGGTLLVANDAGTYAAVADAVYGGGLAAAGGVVALRRAGEGTAVDAAGWGTAGGPWVEGSSASAPPAGSSLARLRVSPDGPLQDTDDNAADFAVGPPTPQPAAHGPSASATPAPSPSASSSTTPTPTPAGSSSPSPSPVPASTPPQTATPSPQATAGPAAVSIATARALPDGTTVTVEGVALTGSAFHDGGGYLADASAGVAVIVDDGEFAAGDTLRVTGSIEDCFAQRTLRADAEDVSLFAPAIATPAPHPVGTGEVGEGVEGSLVTVAGMVVGSPTSLSAGLAFDVDDGSGVVRVIVWSGLGVDTGSWVSGARVELHGVVGQRDSSGSGAAGYRVQPRSAADVLTVIPPASPTATPSASPSLSPSAAAAPTAPRSISDARSAAPGTALTVRGVVTLPPGLVDSEIAVIQDAGAAILLRTDATFGGLVRGTLVEVDGVRSTRAGMETIRLTAPPRTQGPVAEPAPLSIATGGAGEQLEARLVRVKGQLSESARRAASGTVSFDLDDGSGPLRVVIPATLSADDGALLAGITVEVTGVLGQETSGAMPDAGYRVWPRSTTEVRVVHVPVAPAGRVPRAGGAVAPGDREPDEAGAAALSGTLDGIGSSGLADLRIGATLVAGPWPELGIGGLLWDGAHLVALSADSASALAAVGAHRPPVALELSGMRVTGVEGRTGIPVVALSSNPGAVVLGDHGLAPARGSVPEAGHRPAWATLVGRLAERGGARFLRVADVELALDLRCSAPSPLPGGMVAVTGIAIGDTREIVVPCEGLRAAPTLARQAPAANAGRGTGGLALMPKGGDPTLAAVAPASDDGRRALAAGMLGLGVVALLGTVLGRRLRGAALDPPADVEQEPGGEAEVTAPPQLRVISLRREVRD